MDSVAFVPAMQMHNVVADTSRGRAVETSRAVVAVGGARNLMYHSTTKTLCVASMVAAIVCKRNLKSRRTTRHIRSGRSVEAKGKEDESSDDDDEDRASRMRGIRRMQANSRFENSSKGDGFFGPFGGTSAQAKDMAGNKRGPAEDPRAQTVRTVEQVRLKEVVGREEDAKVSRMEMMYRQARLARGEDGSDSEGEE